MGRLVRDGSFDFERLGEVVRTAVAYLDRVIDLNFYPTEAAERSNEAWRPVGLGLMGLQDVFFKLRLPFDGDEARELSRRISEEIYYWALSTSCDLAERCGPHPSYPDTRAAGGKLQMDLWGVGVSDEARWDGLRQRIAAHGLRNSLLIAIAPTANHRLDRRVLRVHRAPGVQPVQAREPCRGSSLQINHYLVRDLQALGLWTGGMLESLKRSQGSLAGINGVPEELKLLYRTAWELPQRALVDLAADRGAFIDQSQSLNLFMETPTIGKLSSMYVYAWRKGLKTTYYLRSRPATRINQAAFANGNGAVDAVTCSLETPETCEACD